MSTSPSHPRPGWGRLLTALLLLAVAAVALRLRFAEQLEPRAALSLLRAFQHQPWALPAFTLAYAVLTTCFFPVILLTMVAGAAWGLEWGLAINLVVYNGVANLQFLLARALGRERFASLLSRYRLDGFEKTARTNGFRTTLAIRLLPMPAMLGNAAAAFAGVRLKDFALGNLAGATHNLVIYTYFAATLVEGVAGAEGRALLHSVGAAALIAALGLGPKLYRHWRERRLSPSP